MPRKRKVDTPKPTRMGDTVLFKFSARDTFPAMVQRVNPDGSCRLYVFGAMSAYPVDDVVEGVEVGDWCNRD
jgi:hypothetical protein